MRQSIQGAMRRRVFLPCWAKPKRCYVVGWFAQGVCRVKTKWVLQVGRAELWASKWANECDGMDRGSPSDRQRLEEVSAEAAAAGLPTGQTPGGWVFGSKRR